ncbi:MAG: hypothetical protein WBW99_22140 [Pseudolabrys sp.]
MPHQAAGFCHVHRLGDDESGDVPYLAVRVFAEPDILNDFVERIARIEFAECAAGDLLVLTCVAVRGARDAFAESRRDFFVNDDFGDARMQRRGTDQNSRDHRKPCRHRFVHAFRYSVRHYGLKRLPIAHSVTTACPESG